MNFSPVIPQLFTDIIISAATSQAHLSFAEIGGTEEWGRSVPG